MFERLLVISIPFNNTFPLDGDSSPAIIESSVDFQQQLGPSKVKNSPFSNL